MGWCEESEFGLKSPAFASCVLLLLASDSALLILSFLSKAMGTRTLTLSVTVGIQKIPCHVIWPLRAGLFGGGDKAGAG